VINKIGVDPDRGGNVKDTSDNFFKNNKNKFDVIFIDGLHIYEQCRKDVINSLKVLSKNGFIFLHDMTPRNWAEENVPRLENTLWTGNIWKVALELSKTQGIDFFVINADMGVGVLKKNEQNIVYHDEYENLKDLKFRDFLNLNESIKYVECEEALKLIASN
jgi:predicted O-methyltransferase YrrM